MSQLTGSLYKTAKSVWSQTTSSTASKQETEGEGESLTEDLNKEFHGRVVSLYIEDKLAHAIVEKSSEIRFGPPLNERLYEYANTVIDHAVDGVVSTILTCDLLDVVLQEKLPHDCLERIESALEHNYKDEEFRRSVESALSGGSPYHYIWLNEKIMSRVVGDAPAAPKEWTYLGEELVLDEDGFYKSPEQVKEKT